MATPDELRFVEKLKGVHSSEWLRRLWWKLTQSRTKNTNQTYGDWPIIKEECMYNNFGTVEVSTNPDVNIEQTEVKVFL